MRWTRSVEVDCGGEDVVLGAVDEEEVRLVAHGGVVVRDKK